LSLGVNFDEVMSDSINGPNFAARPQIDRLWMFVSVWIFLLGLILSNLGLFSIFNGIATLLDPHTSNTTSIVVPFLYAVSFFCVGPTGKYYPSHAAQFLSMYPTYRHYSAVFIVVHDDMQHSSSLFGAPCSLPDFSCGASVRQSVFELEYSFILWFTLPVLNFLR
jgi:hypothetical protein